MSVRKHQQGYAMIVVAMLLVAFMAVVGALLEGDVVEEQIGRQARAREQLSTLIGALAEYAVYNNNRYPCPARPDIAYTDATFGEEIDTCEAGALDAGALDGIEGLPNNLAGSEIIRGIVPVRELAAYGITIDDAFDPWGDRIMYIVNRQLTPDGTSITATRPTLSEDTTSSTLEQPDLILISYGKDKVGGTVRSQIAPIAACPDLATVDAEENCDKSLVFMRKPLNISANATSATYFDDILMPYTSDLASGCAATAVTWLTSCSATPGATLPEGATLTVKNGAGGFNGSATITCQDGTYQVTNMVCEAAGGTCTWALYYDTWTSTTNCANIPGWSGQQICGTDAPCSGIDTSEGSNMTYAAAAAGCTNAVCRESAVCTLDYGDIANSATAIMRICNPD